MTGFCSNRVSTCADTCCSRAASLSSTLFCSMIVPSGVGTEMACSRCRRRCDLSLSDDDPELPFAAPARYHTHYVTDTCSRFDITGGTCNGEVSCRRRDTLTVLSFALERAFVRLRSFVDDETLEALHVVCFRFVARMLVCHDLVVHEPLLKYQLHEIKRRHKFLKGGASS